MSSSVQSMGGGLWSVLATFWTFAFMVFWMIVGWRAMRAHERIAASLEEGNPR